MAWAPTCPACLPAALFLEKPRARQEGSPRWGRNDTRTGAQDKNVICGVGECGVGECGVGQTGGGLLAPPVRRPRYRPGPNPYGAPQLRPSSVVVFGRYSQPIQPR